MPCDLRLPVRSLASILCCIVFFTWVVSDIRAQEPAKCEVSRHDGTMWTVETGCLDVPLDPAQPGGPRVPIYYEISRPTKRPMGVILNFHGGPGYPRAHIPENGVLWEGMLAHYTFLYFHQRGCGYSGRVTDSKQLRGLEAFYSLDVVIEDARELLDALVPGVPVAVFGKSAGGFLSLLFALRYPDRVSHVIAACTGPDGEYLRRREEVKAMFMEDMNVRFAGFNKSLRKARVKLGSSPPSELLDPSGQTTPLGLLEAAFFDLSYSVRGQYEMVAIVREAETGQGKLLAQRLKRGQANLEGDGLESPVLLQHISCRELGHGDLHPFACMGTPRAAEPYDVKPRLAELTMPVLVLSGLYDSVLPVHYQEDIVDNLLAASPSWSVFRWSGHMVFQEQPRASAEVILRFLGIDVPQMPQSSGM